MSRAQRVMIRTFRFRLSLISAAVVLMLFLCVAYAIHRQYRNELLDTVDEDLMRDAKVAVSLPITGPGQPGLREYIKRVGDDYFQIVNDRQQTVISSLSNNHLWPVNKKLMTHAFAGTAQYETLRHQGEKFRLLYFPAGEDRIVRIGQPISNLDRVSEKTRKFFYMGFPLAAGLAFLLSWVLVGRALSPMVRIKETAARILEGRVGERVDVGIKGREVDELVLLINRMLESIQGYVEAQKRFTSDVSHEIRSPLTSLRGSMEVALRKKRLPEEYENVLRDNLADVIRLSRITDNLLLLARADNNILEMRKQWIDVGGLLRTVVDRLKSKAGSSGLSITEDYAETLEMKGDSELLEQAFTNIIDNAIKYTPEGGTILVKASRESDEIRVSVRDTGIGIPAGEVPHVFERFYRVHKDRSRRAGGTGLGLAISLWIVRAHHGTITVQSNEGSGSEFTCVFSLASE